MNRPYFETKIVKVGKEKKLHTQYCTNPGLCPYQRFKENRKNKESKHTKNCEIRRCEDESGKFYCYTHKEYFKKKGNYVNGENLDKIKFPCFCSYMYEGEKKRYGILTYNRSSNCPYEIIMINRQFKGEPRIYSFDTLKNLIKGYDIHILKGKIIIYEEK